MTSAAFFSPLRNKRRLTFFPSACTRISAEIQASARDFVKLNQLMEEKEKAEKELEEKMDRWMYLEELAAKIAEQQG